MGKHIFTRIRAELQSMKESSDPGYTKSIIPWNRDRQFSVECTRYNEDDNVSDDVGNVICDLSGKVLGFEVYYQVGKKDTDCCTLSSYLDNSDMESLDSFIKMYR